MIRLIFPCPADAPNGKASTRLRWAQRGDTVKLGIARGLDLTPEWFAALQMDGARVTVTKPQERNIVATALNISPDDIQMV